MIDYTTNPDWATPTHFGKEEKLTDDEKALNQEGVLEALCDKLKKSGGTSCRSDKTGGALVHAILASEKKSVIMVKGVHQAKFGSGNARDQHRLDQTHYRVTFQGKSHHIYVQPNLAQKWDITEVT